MKKTWKKLPKSWEKTCQKPSFLLHFSTLKKLQIPEGSEVLKFFSIYQISTFLVVFCNPKNGKKHYISALEKSVAFCIGFGRVFWGFFLGFWGRISIEKALKERRGAFPKMSVSPTREGDFRGFGVWKRRKKPSKRREKNSGIFEEEKAWKMVKKGCQKTPKKLKKTEKKKE